MIRGALLLAAAMTLVPAAMAQTAHHKAAKPARSAKTSAEKIGENGVPLSKEHVHLVREGETLGGIATRAKVPRILIAEANGLKEPWSVHAGQRLLLPRTRHHVVKEGETGFDIAYQYGVPLSSILVANGRKEGAKVKAGEDLLIPTMLHPAKPGAADGLADAKPRPKPESDADEAHATPRFVWPVNGPVRRGFTARGKANFHDGLDISASEGTAARAIAPGTVLFAKEEPDSFGRLVVIDHGNGWQSAYGFLNRITVKEGDQVKATERVGLVGHSGKATSDELHFEIRHDNHPVDPEKILPREGKRKVLKKD